MAGYDGWSMSNNARDAYAAGEMPASRIAAATGLTTTEVRRLSSPSSWHHTSSKFNCTDFFTLDEVLEAANEERHGFNLSRRPKLRKNLIECVQRLRQENRLFREGERQRLRQAATELLRVVKAQLPALPPAPPDVVRFKLYDLQYQRMNYMDEFRRQRDRVGGERINRTLLACGVKLRSGGRLRRQIERAVRREFNATFPTRGLDERGIWN